MPAQKDAEKRRRDFEFNLRELAGSMGDFGTLFPLAIGYIAVNGLDPAGLFIALGLTNIALGLIYRMPMPVEPKKVIAVTAIAQQWSPSIVYASGFGLGILWLFLVFTGLLRKLVAITPPFIVRGIQLALGITLGWQALKMMAPAPLLGVLAVAIVLLLRQNRYAPASLVLMALGVGIVAWQGNLPASWDLGLALPPLTLPRLRDVWQAMLLAGLAQIPLSITNAVIAPAVLIRDYFPEKAAGERKLMLNMGGDERDCVLFRRHAYVPRSGRVCRAVLFWRAHGRRADHGGADRGGDRDVPEPLNLESGRRLSDGAGGGDDASGRDPVGQRRGQAARVEIGAVPGHGRIVGGDQHGRGLCGRAGPGLRRAGAQAAVRAALSLPHAGGSRQRMSRQCGASSSFFSDWILSKRAPTIIAAASQAGGL